MKKALFKKDILSPLAILTADKANPKAVATLHNRSKITGTNPSFLWLK